MLNHELMKAIQAVNCFQGISQEDLERVAAMGHMVSLDANQTLFREGDPATTSYVIVAGTISLEICAPGVGCRRISTVRDGEFLGWSPVLSNSRLSVTARAVTSAQLIAFPQDALLRLCEQSPRFGYIFMRGVAQTLARRLSAARMQLLNLFGNEADTPADHG